VLETSPLLSPQNPKSSRTLFSNSHDEHTSQTTTKQKPCLGLSFRVSTLLYLRPYSSPRISDPLKPFPQIATITQNTHTLSLSHQLSLSFSLSLSLSLSLSQRSSMTKHINTWGLQSFISSLPHLSCLPLHKTTIISSKPQQRKVPIIDPPISHTKSP
jgi:hypothetical protein